MSAVCLPGLAGEIASTLPDDAVGDLYDRGGAQVYEHLVSSDQSELEAIVRALTGIDGRVLELACGGGRVTAGLLAAGHRVHAVDNSPSMLEILRARLAVDGAAGSPLTTALGDMAQFESDESFDALVVAAGSIILLDPQTRARALATVRRRLRPGAIAVLTGMDIAAREAPERVIPFTGAVSGRVIEYVEPDRAQRWTSVAVEDEQGRVQRLLWSRPQLLSAGVLRREMELAGFEGVATTPLSAAAPNPLVDRQWILTARAPGAMPAARPVVFFTPPARRGAQPLRAAGCEVQFDDGTVALDGASGLWNVNLGYGNRAIADAVHEAHLDASYLTLFRRGHRYAEAASAALAAFAAPIPVSRVLFSTCGAAAVDAAQKVVRQYHALRGEGERKLIVGLRGSYHGMTFGGLALTGDEFGQRGLGVDRSLVRHIRHDSADQLRRLLQRDGERIGGVIVEPVLGSGAYVVSEELLDALFEARRDSGLLVVADEVATGFGRCGRPFASQGWREPPDLVITSKALTNGTCAAAAVLLGPQVALPFDIADSAPVHGETQAGTPASCAAICATIAEFERLGAIATSARVAERLDRWIQRILGDVDAAVAAEGAGCFRAVHLRDASGGRLSPGRIEQIVEDCRKAGAIVHPGPSCVQLLPVLTCSDDELDSLMSRVRQSLATIGQAGDDAR